MKRLQPVAFSVLISLGACASPATAVDPDPVSNCSCGDPEIEVLGCPASCAMSPESHLCINDLCLCDCLPAVGGTEWSDQE